MRVCFRRGKVRLSLPVGTRFGARLVLRMAAGKDGKPDRRRLRQTVRELSASFRTARKVFGHMVIFEYCDGEDFCLRLVL